MLILCCVAFPGSAIGVLVGDGEVCSRCTRVGKRISIFGDVGFMVYGDRLLGYRCGISLLKRHGVKGLRIGMLDVAWKWRICHVMAGVVKHLAGAGRVPRMIAIAPLQRKTGSELPITPRG